MNNRELANGTTFHLK